MSFLVGPIINYGVHLTMSSVGTILSYSAQGVWYLTKRAIWGVQKTPEQVQLEHIKETQDEIKEAKEELKEVEEKQGQIILALEAQLKQNQEIIQLLSKGVVKCSLESVESH